LANVFEAAQLSGERSVETETQLLQTLTRSIAEAEDLGSALSAVLQEVCAFTGWEYGEAWLPDIEGVLVERALTWCGGDRARQFRALSEGVAFSPGEGLPGRVWASRQPMWLHDVTFTARDAGLNAAVGIPVLARDQAEAVLTFYAQEQRQKDNGLLALVSSVAAQLGLLIHRKRAEEALRASEEKFHALAATASDAIVVADSRGDVTYFSAGAERAFGCEAGAVIGRPIAALLSEELYQAYQTEVRRLLAPGGRPEPDRTVEGTARRIDGLEFPVELTLATWAAKGQSYVNAIIRDVTDRKQAEERIRRLAFHDPLTDLPNRLLFGDRLQMALSRARRHRQRVAVLFMNLDRFNRVNDSLGHALGDLLLQEVAGRLRACSREDDTLARFGNDEFTLLLSSADRVEDAIRVADGILKTLEPPFSPAGRELFVSPSIGIALYPDDGEDLETLVKNAASAMHTAKERGGNRWQLSTSALQEKALHRLNVENELHLALARRELLIHYQPILEVRSGRIRSLEALVRWQHPKRGLLLPNEFIGLAETTGLVVPLGRQVLEVACAQTRAWHEGGHPDLAVAVNISARELLEPGFPEQVLHVLRDTRLGPQFLDLEITENGAMRSVARAAGVIAKLKAAGVRVSIDDFGVGHSSLSHLRGLPVDTLKIDQSFVQRIGAIQRDRAIVNAMIVMAHALKLQVVAEGVETGTQLAFLSARRCNYIQGNLFSPPVPPEEVPALLERGAPSKAPNRSRRRAQPARDEALT
jgi:diguanylate cyclase (GGDEF)-like protein/PAS domain S-box-containing protein